MKRLFISFFLLLILNNGFSQFYNFDSIPDNLKKGADAVIRSEQCLYTISDPGHAVKKIRKIITLMNENADHYRYLEVEYDKYSKVNYVKGTVYDEKGSPVKFLGSENISDMSAITGGSFYSDDRIKVMRFPIYKYPYTIEYEYEISYSSLINYLSWDFQDSKEVSVEKSGIQFIVPVDIKLRFNEESMKNKVDSVTLKNKTIYTWQEENIPALSTPNSLDWTYISNPNLSTAPLEFEYAGYKGSMSSWKQFGNWIYAINKDRDLLPQYEQDTVKHIISRYSDKKNQIKAIYEYMQSKTRYVSVQIGIGGYRTAEAADVSKNGFGDCKALTNYTKALLNYAGISSYFAMVYAGDEAKDINTTFVNNCFNHVILCVPLSSDTIWLECTNQTKPFNYLGSFTCGRHVLVIKPEGGILAKTPDFKKEDNYLKRTGTIFINPIGESSAKFQLISSGYFFNYSDNEYSDQSEKELKKSLYSSFEYPDFQVKSASYSSESSEKPKGDLNFELGINDLGLVKGQQLYFNPTIVKNDFIPEDSVALKITTSCATIDSLTFFLPEGYKIESLPDKVSVTNEFGSFYCTMIDSGQKITLFRRLELNKGLVPVEKYNQFRDFYNSVARTDKRLVVLNHL